MLVYTGPVKSLNIHEAKTHLSRVLAELEEGETLLLCRRNVPVAEVRKLASAPTEPRPVGLARGSFEVPPSFFEPLPDDILDAFEGRGG